MSRTTCFDAGASDKKGEDNGLLFLLVIRTGDARLEVGRGLEPIITDGRRRDPRLRQMRPALRESQYGDALWIAATSLAVSSRKTRVFRSILERSAGAQTGARSRSMTTYRGR